ncbi:low-density lipoprotein receptor domain class A domain-containing protein [Phthorimaea operculella]|nr:low-density lipoprotein receptor domain class A domain-containing protein [Phthorimaea operculella]
MTAPTRLAAPWSLKRVTIAQMTESSARCNGVPDCDDGSDEAGCPVVTEAGPAPDNDNSYDNAPERGDGNPFDVATPAYESTTYPDSRTTCRNDELRCDETRCLPLSARCDRVRDCDDGQDEQNCEGESLSASAEESAATTLQRRAALRRNPLSARWNSRR